MRRVTLKEARLRKRLTQEELSDATGVYQVHISRLETGKTLNPSFETVIKLAKALEIDPQQLKFGVPESKAIAS